jgi:arabinosyltransferase C
VAATPAVVITAPTAPDDPDGGGSPDPALPGDIVAERWVGGPSGLLLGTGVGASFAGLEQTGTLKPAVTRLDGEPGRRWGQILVADHGDLAVDRYDVTTQRRVLDETGGDPPPVFDPRPVFGPLDPADAIGRAGG